MLFRRPSRRFAFPGAHRLVLARRFAPDVVVWRRTMEHFVACPGCERPSVVPVVGERAHRSSGVAEVHASPATLGAARSGDSLLSPCLDVAVTNCYQSIAVATASQRYAGRGRRNARRHAREAAQHPAVPRRGCARRCAGFALRAQSGEPDALPDQAGLGRARRSGDGCIAADAFRLDEQPRPEDRENQAPRALGSSRPAPAVRPAPRDRLRARGPSRLRGSPDGRSRPTSSAGERGLGARCRAAPRHRGTRSSCGGGQVKRENLGPMLVARVFVALWISDDAVRQLLRRGARLWRRPTSPSRRSRSSRCSTS